MENLAAACPIVGTCQRGLVTWLRARADFADITPRCTITKINYMGDPGGIACGLDFGLDAGRAGPVVSLTHLSFDIRHPLSREVAAYQKHRIKRLRKQRAAPL